METHLCIQVECYAEHPALGQNKKAFSHIIQVIGEESLKFFVHSVLDGFHYKSPPYPLIAKNHSGKLLAALGGTPPPVAENHSAQYCLVECGGTPPP